MAISTRRATVADVDELLLDVQLGFDSYVGFAPLGWEPPDMFAGRDRTAELIQDPATWMLVALDGDTCAGHVAFSPVHAGLVHLWQLFVRPAWWGAGVGPGLHDAALAEMRARGFARGRLLTPSLHARARRFYERRGWSVTGEQWSEDLGLMLTEYGRPLD
jgi:GNAT superfamily N-acetyltransferase